MTLHQALRVIDHTLTPETTKFSDYVLETSDDNLFLRTCFCKKDWQLEDRELPVNNSSPLIDRVGIHIFDKSWKFFS